MGDGSKAVLVVDDEAAIRLLYRVNLELDGFTVLEASSLEQARRRLDDDQVSLVLLDMHIGADRGETLLHELDGRGIPVIIVSGSAEVDGDSRHRAAAVLGKPFTIDELLGAVRSAAR